MKKVIGILILLCFFAILPGYGHKISSERDIISHETLRINSSKEIPHKEDMGQVKGNLSGNIVNGGLFVYSGDYVYGNINNKLYRSRVDGPDQTMLCSDDASYLNIIGDWIYYSNNSDNQKLYKIKTDGTGRTKVCEDRVWLVSIEGEWIYYGKILYMDGPVKLSRISRINMDGTNKSILCPDNIDYMNVHNGWIYYRNIGESQNSLCKMRVDGTKKIKLSEDDAWNINADDDWVYYSNGTDDGKLYRIRADGTEKSKISDDRADSLNTSGSWVFYWDASDYDDNNFTCNYKLYKVRTDGTDKSLFQQENIRIEYCPIPMPDINVVKDCIYYHIPVDNTSGRLKLCSISINNTAEQVH